MKCYLCGEIKLKMTRDHVIPKSLVPKKLRGSFYNAPNMILPCCFDCNQIKSNRTLEQTIELTRKIFLHQYEKLLRS